MAIGQYVLDLSRVSHLFTGPIVTGTLAKSVFSQPTLNDFMSLGCDAWTEVRGTIRSLLSQDSPVIRDDVDLRQSCLKKVSDVKLHMPVKIGDYTDFYSSKEHATNVGIMFRGKDNPLLPNWSYIPVGYHGRSSSVVISGTDVKRPKGQVMLPDATRPVFKKCHNLDFELEMGFLIGGPENPLGTPIQMKDAHKRIFGMVIVNDWSARDIQKFEYVPLGPFLAKNFQTSISPWVVPMIALEPFKVPNVKQDPIPADYLLHDDDYNFDISLSVDIIPNGNPNGKTTICKSNFKYLYWSMKQQLTHHSITGCNMRSGDLLASGTISGPTPESYGSMLELSWSRTKPIKLNDGSERCFLEDGDEVIMSGLASNGSIRVGFGSCTGLIKPADD